MSAETKHFLDLYTNNFQYVQSMHEMKGLGQQPVFSVSLINFRRRVTGQPDKSPINVLDNS